MFVPLAPSLGVVNRGAVSSAARWRIVYSRCRLLLNLQAGVVFSSNRLDTSRQRNLGTSCQRNAKTPAIDLRTPQSLRKTRGGSHSHRSASLGRLAVLPEPEQSLVDALFTSPITPVYLAHRERRQARRRAREHVAGER